MEPIKTPWETEWRLKCQRLGSKMIVPRALSIRDFSSSDLFGKYFFSHMVAPHLGCLLSISLSQKETEIGK